MEKGDFILIELEGRDENGNVFDSTKGEVAKKLYGKESPLLVIVGRTPLLKGIEEQLYKMNVGDKREIIVPPSKGFGNRDKNNIMVIPLSNFEKMPHVGDVISVESNGVVKVGVVISISSGRVMLDTNHPLAGRTTYFTIEVLKKFETDEEKAEALLKENVKDFTVEKGKAVVRDKLKEEEKEALRNLLKDYNVNIELIFE